eukprot:TRINITY_DN396_c0_g1_i1.p1 TRINITY_DN396_c0_g1~~TRINITY_DN396_c0_g1_i1.p1  ORF type:complete len:858 (+),score=102.37 TRINITY_DN396_c0_g1_i1:78-2651(+)
MSTDLNKLLRDSQRLAQTGYQDFPQINRSLPQVEKLSQNLKRKANRFEAIGTNLSAYNRILAAGGIDGNRLESETQSLQIQPVVEDIVPAQENGLNSSTQMLKDNKQHLNVKETIQLNGYQDHNSDYYNRFLSYEWNKRPRLMMNPENTIVSGVEQGVRSRSLSQHRSLSPGASMGVNNRSVTPFGQNSASLGSVPPTSLRHIANPYTPQLGAQEKALGGQVCDLMAYRVRGSQFDAAERFLGAVLKAESEEGACEQSVASKKCWGILECQVKEAMGSLSVEALLRGSRRQLENQHAQYVLDQVQKNRAMAKRSGEPSKIMDVKAFLRVKYQDNMPVNLTWMVLYLSVRSGWYYDAVEEFQSECTKDVIEGLRLLESGEQMDVMLQARLSREANRSVGVLQAQRGEMSVNDRFRALTYTVLARDGQVAQKLFQVCPNILVTIEDYMWFKLALTSVGDPQDMQPYSSLNGGPLASSDRTGNPAQYKLSDLHKELQQWSYKHYCQNEKDPYLYVRVCLWSLQFKTALAFLVSDQGGGYRIDAVHYGITMFNHKILECGGVQDIGFEGVTVNLGALVQEYGKRIKMRRYQNSNELSLAYYMLAAEIRSQDNVDKDTRTSNISNTLYEYVAEGDSYSYLLDGGALLISDSSSPIAKYLPNVEDRRQVLMHLANVLHRNAQHSQALNIYLAADDAMSAIKIINQLISGLLQQNFDKFRHPSQDEELKKLVELGNDAQNQLMTNGFGTKGGERGQIETFVELQKVGDLLMFYMEKDMSKAVNVIRRIAFIPLEQHRMDACVDSVNGLPPSLQDRLGMLIIIAGEVLLDSGLKQELQVVSRFANQIGTKLPQVVLAKITVMAAR